MESDFSDRRWLELSLGQAEQFKLGGIIYHPVHNIALFPECKSTHVVKTRIMGPTVREADC